MPLEFDTTPSTSPAGATGRYTTQALMQSTYGLQNIAQWADKENTADPGVIQAAVQEAINWAEDEIDGEFNESRYVTPFAPVPSKVETWARTLAVVKLYQGRGLLDTGDDVAGKMTSVEKKVRLEMTMYAGGTLKFPSAASQNSKKPGGPTVVPIENPNPYNNAYGLGTLDPFPPGSQ